METKSIKKKMFDKDYLKERYGFNFAHFLTLVKMLLQDKLKISFKANKKQSIIKIVSFVVGFIVLTAASWLLYYIVQLLHLFSVLSYIPLTVPSLISTVIFVLAFLGAIFGLTRTLYYSNDNRLMITYPCNGNTIFLARLFVYFVNEVIRNSVIQIPLFLGYMIVMNFPLYMIIWLIIGIVLVTLVEVLIASLISIPVYYANRFLEKFSLIKSFIGLFIILIFVGGISYVVYLIPESIDIFTNWGPYFRRIQAFLNGYGTYCSPFYFLTQFLIGNLNGFVVQPFTLTTLYVGLVLIGSIALLFGLCLLVVNPIYFKLASESFEFESDTTFISKRVKKRRYVNSQIHKELLLFLKDPNYSTSIIGSFIFLPIILTLMNKLYGAMNVNHFGDYIVSCVNVLVILIIALNSNSVVAKSYSDEGNAFKYNLVYPKNSYFLLFSKNIIPFSIGTISILISCFLFGFLKDVGVVEVTLMFFGIIFIYLAHMLFASQLDFCSITSQFSRSSAQTKAQRVISITAFVIPIILVLLFFLYLNDNILTAYIKLLVLGIIIFAISLWIYILRVKLVYQEGN